MPLIVMALLQGASALPLPQNVIIPVDYSSIQCPNEAAALKMIDFFTVRPAPNNHIADTDTFFDGLRATGCVQNGPKSKTPITIKKIMARKTITLADNQETYAVFTGQNAAGVVFTGVVNETGNDNHPRNAYQRWLSEWTRKGIITITRERFADPAYTCATPSAARSAVRGLPLKGSEKSKRAAFAKALQANKCVRAAEGDYHVTAVHEARTISCGFECEDNYTALSVTRGRWTVGLIFDASHF